MEKGSDRVESIDRGQLVWLWAIDLRAKRLAHSVGLNGDAKRASNSANRLVTSH